MRCIVCDRCKAVIENPRRCRVITCARPLSHHLTCDKGHIPYRGNDPQQNDFIWEREICENCLDELDSFFETGGATDTPEHLDPPSDDTEDTEDQDGVP